MKLIDADAVYAKIKKLMFEEPIDDEMTYFNSGLITALGVIEDAEILPKGVIKEAIKG